MYGYIDSTHVPTTATQSIQKYTHDKSEGEKKIKI